MQFGFRFMILLFSTSVRFSTKTSAYLACKAFMAFKRSQLNPLQKYRLITSFSVDGTRGIQLVYASVSLKYGFLSVCTIKLQVIVNKDIAPPSPKQQSQNKFKMSDKKVL